MEQPRVSRRAFVAGAAATVVGLGTGGIVVLGRDGGGMESLPARPAWLPRAADAHFRQADLADEEAIYASGGRRSTHPTGGYAAESVPKARIEGEDPRRLVLPDAGAGLVLPAAGLVPRDAWTMTVVARNATGRDLSSLPSVDEPPVLLGAGAVLVWLLAPDELGAAHLGTGQQASRALASGDWPADAWRRVTVGWHSHDATLWLALGEEADGHTAGPPDQPPEKDLPPGGVNSGLLVGGSDTELQPFELADAELHAGLWRPGHPAPEVAGRTLRIDAAAPGDAWSTALSGSLALYADFELGAPAADPARRDAQYALVYDEAASRLVRFGGPLNLLGLEPEGDGFALDTAALDTELDALLAERPGLALHLTLDYTPAALQPAGGDHRSAPTDPQAWADIAAEVVAHVAARYGGQLFSVTLWNEPDHDSYWTGTPEQLYELWELTQTRLLDAGHGYRLGSPEYAFTPGIEAFFAWLAERPEPLRASVSAVYVHDFQQDLHEVRNRLAAARAAAEGAGVGDVPLRITEYNLSLGQIAERRTDEDSWYRTQPPHFTSEYAPAHAIHLLWEALDQDMVDMAVFAALGTPELFWGEQALTTSDDEIRPLPAWSAIALLGRLEGRRIRAEAGWPAVRALATRDEAGVVMVVYASFRPYRGFLEDVEFELDWTGLPATFTWQRWQLDRDHVDDDRPALAGEGDETDLPDRLRLGALGVGGIRIEPR